MLAWALLFLILTAVAAAFGFTGIAAGAAMLAKVLFVAFLALFLAALVAALLRKRAPPEAR